MSHRALSSEGRWVSSKGTSHGLSREAGWARARWIGGWYPGGLKSTGADRVGPGAESGLAQLTLSSSLHLSRCRSILVPPYRTIADQQNPRPPRPSRRSPSRTPLSRPTSFQTSPNRPRIQNPSSRSRSSRSPNLLLSPRKWLYDSHCRRYRTRETRFRKGDGLGYWYISFT